MTFNTLKEAKKFYKDYSKVASFFTKIRNANRKEIKLIKNYEYDLNDTSTTTILLYDLITSNPSQ
ncbi:hypothetical protein AHAS_Ahas11G0232200 [Arachis hypogaea]